MFEKGQLTLGLYCMAGSESAVSVRAWSRQSPRRHATNVPTSVYLFLAVCESSPTLPLVVRLPISKQVMVLGRKGGGLPGFIPNHTEYPT